jgi:hypothetical protein
MAATTSLQGQEGGSRGPKSALVTLKKGME